MLQARISKYRREQKLLNKFFPHNTKIIHCKNILSLLVLLLLFYDAIVFVGVVVSETFTILKPWESDKTMCHIYIPEEKIPGVAWYAHTYTSTVLPKLGFKIVFDVLCLSKYMCK